MPPHPLNACCCHVIAQAVTNIARLAEDEDSEHVAVETAHVAPVIAMLDEYLLRKDYEQLKQDALRYWATIRPVYLTRADDQSVRDFDTAWYMYAFALGVPYP
jgi:hypothetical protein